MCNEMHEERLYYSSYDEVNNSCHEYSTECWCCPDVEEFEDGSLLVIHRDKSEAN